MHAFRLQLMCEQFHYERAVLPIMVYSIMVKALPNRESAISPCSLMHRSSFLLVLNCAFFGCCLPPLLAQQTGIDTESTEVAGDQAGLRFQFQSAPWLDVLNWFAQQTSLSLDWKELPEGELNLTTQQSYSAAEALGVINRHLAPRGFTLLRRNDVAFLVKLDSPLNPTMVPRVEPRELHERSPYEFVKTSFPLDWLIAEAAVEEFRPLLSPYGKISPFSATNRIEVIDFAENVLEIHMVLEHEGSDESQELLVAEFRLQHAKAGNVLTELRELMGLETPIPRSTAIFMELRRAQNNDSRNRDSNEKSLPVTEKRVNDVHLVANERQNSIVANAPPDKIAIIRQAVSVLDVQSTDVGMMFSSETMMKVYPLNGVDPDALQDIFEDLRNIGKLHQDSVFSEDDDTQILFAHASIKDHLTIQSVMDQLARASRTFQVVPLAQLNAEAVVAAIGNLMGGESEVGRSSDGRSRDRGRQNSSEWGGFRAEADPVNSRLLLFATESELRQVKTLLTSMGEREKSNRVRVVEGADRESTEDAVKRLKALWPAIESTAVETESTANPPAAKRKEPSNDASADVSLGHQPVASPLDGLPQKLRLVATQELDPSGRVSTVASAKFSPQGKVGVEIGADGNVILRSDDPDAIEEAERILRALLPDKQRYHLIKTKNQSPANIGIKIDEALALDVVPTRGPVSLIADSVTSTLMIVGANESEFQQIEKLANLFDKPVAPNPESERKPRLFELQYAKAERVAATLKELYRDLLSPVDSAFERNRVSSRSRGESESEELDRVAVSNPTMPYMGTESTKVAFKGMLSVSIVAESNSVAVSAPAFIMGEIAETIAELDSPDTAEVVRVISVNQINPDLLRSTLVNGLGVAGGNSATREGGTAQSSDSVRSNVGGENGDRRDR